MSWQQIFSFYLSENPFISPSVLKAIFSEYRIVYWPCFSFSPFKMSFHYLLTSIMFVEKLAVSIIVGPFKTAGVSKLLPCPFIYVLPVSDFTAMVEVSRYIRNNMACSAYSIYYLALYWKDVLTCSSRKCFFLCMLLRFSFSLIFSSLTMLYLVQFSWFLSCFLKI